MPYKDKEQTAKAMRDYRKRQKGITGKDNETRDNTEGITQEPWYPNKPTDELGNPIKAVTLSDGQKWYPQPVITENDTGLPDDILKRVLSDGERFGRTEERIRKALKYQEWAKGQPRPGVYQDEGAAA